jgi:hypothetical protein
MTIMADATNTKKPRKRGPKENRSVITENREVALQRLLKKKGRVSYEPVDFQRTR